ncbi:protein FosB-like isoform X2 [Pseudorasbora parva]|uniref:protein FosB-like isoform X2 n=1 Tax=Pseudorasbora parva TaxID=51549 RepID=UPI00351DFB6C
MTSQLIHDWPDSPHDSDHLLPACTRLLSPIACIQPQPMSTTPPGMAGTGLGGPGPCGVGGPGPRGVGGPGTSGVGGHGPRSAGRPGPSVHSVLIVRAFPACMQRPLSYPELFIITTLQNSV